VFGFCSHVELCRLRQTGKLFHRICSQDELWRGLSLKQALVPPAEASVAMQAMSLRTYRQLVEATHKLQLPQGMLGYWRTEGGAGDPQDGYEGELLSITAIAGGLMCRTVQGDGSKRELFRVRVKARPAPEEGVVVSFFNLEHDLSPHAVLIARGTIGAAKVGLRRISSTSFQLVRSGVPRTFVRVQQPSPAQDLQGADALRQMPDVEGLWSAHYVSSAAVILQTTLHLQQQPSAAAAAAAPASAAAGSTAPPQLLMRGAKVVGSSNTNSGSTGSADRHWSFAVDLARGYDVAAEMAATSGLVVAFVAGGAHVIDLHARAPSIARWCKGQGHVNGGAAAGAARGAVVDVDCLVYGPRAAHGFSIIWREPKHGVRIIVDFARL
ncbi:hypothetical protein JKP88DRAFT_131300, partial [Tribonema minus]